MPIRKSIPNPHGEGDLADAWHRVQSVDVDRARRSGQILVASYSSEAAFKAGRAPVATQHFGVYADAVSAAPAVPEVPEVPGEPRVVDGSGAVVREAVKGRARVPGQPARKARPSFDDAFSSGDVWSAAERYLLAAHRDFDGATIVS